MHEVCHNCNVLIGGHGIRSSGDLFFLISVNEQIERDGMTQEEVGEGRGFEKDRFSAVQNIRCGGCKYGNAKITWYFGLDDFTDRRWFRSADHQVGRRYPVR